MPRRNRRPIRRRRRPVPQQTAAAASEGVDTSTLDAADFDYMARQLVNQGKASPSVLEGVNGTPRARMDRPGTPGGPSKVERRPETLTRSHENSFLSIKNGRFSGGGGS